MVKISVIVPVYNVEKYLSRCLDSIIAQTYKDLEIILLDDGSSDNSFEIMSQYTQKDYRIKIEKCEHQGVAKIRKKGIDLAEGEYIGFVDSDDWIDPNMYSSLYETMVNDGCDLVSSDVFAHDENGNEWVDYDNYKEGLCTNLRRDIYPTMLHDFSVNIKGFRCYLVSKLFRADMLKAVVKKIDDRVFYGEDAMIFYRYCLACNSVHIMRRPFYHYNKHAGSAETKPNENEPENMYRLFLNLKQAFEESPFRDVLMPQLYQYAILLNNRVLRGLYGIDLGQINSWCFPGLEDLYGKKLVIYGAGACGKALFKELWENGHTEQIVAVIDKNYDKIAKQDRKTASEFLESLNYKIRPISAIKNIDFDNIVVAIYNKTIAEEAIRELQDNWGVSRERIVWINSYKKSLSSLLSVAFF